MAFTWLHLTYPQNLGQPGPSTWHLLGPFQADLPLLRLLTPLAPITPDLSSSQCSALLMLMLPHLPEGKLWQEVISDALLYLLGTLKNEFSAAIVVE